MINALQIRQKLFDWLDGRISLRQFEAWFVPATWDAHQSNAETKALVDDIELNLFEYSDGHMTQDDLRLALLTLVQSHSSPASSLATAATSWPIRVVFGRSPFEASSANQYFPKPLRAVA